MNRENPRYIPGAACPWDGVQHSRTVAEGIQWITAAGHGGFRVSESRYAKMPMHLRQLSWTADQYFEEDCAWCAVVLAFPEEFTTRDIETAQRTYAAILKDRL